MCVFCAKDVSFKKNKRCTYGSKYDVKYKTGRYWRCNVGGGALTRKDLYEMCLRAGLFSGFLIVRSVCF